MADQKDTYGYESKFTGGRVPPEKLVIVGIDCLDSQRPELADPDRIRIPIDEEMVKSIARFGVRVPVLIRKFDGDKNVYVVAGRRRVLHAREANRRAGGDAPVLVPCMPEKNDPIASLVIENEFRVNNTPLMKARQAQRLLDRGYDEAQVAAMCGVKVGTIPIWRALVATPPSVQRAVEENKITATVAVEIAKLPPADQDAALAEAIKSGRGGDTLERVRLMRKPRPASGEDEKPRRLTIAQIKAFSKEMEVLSGAGDEVDVARCVLLAILGEGAKVLRGYPLVTKAFKRATRGEDSNA